jgi:hypothetical protein
VTRVRRRNRIELAVTTAVFVAVGGGLTVARGHIVGDIFVLLLAPLLAAGLTLAARYVSDQPR